MSGEISSLALGILFNVLFVLLAANCTNMFRSSAPLSTPVAFLFLYLGETLSTLPLFLVAWRNWTVTSPRRWATYLFFGSLMNANFLLWRAASAIMPLGTYASIVCSGILFSPLLAAGLQRRCVSVVDVAGILAALIGLMLVTDAAFLFQHAIDVPVRGYCFAAINGILSLIYPFFFGATKDEHWSNFLVLRLICGSVLAGVCLCLAGGPAALVSAPTGPSISVAIVGVSSTVYRLSQQVGCYELEAFDEGLAGLLGNIIHAGIIPITAIFSTALFGEVLSASETVGVVLVFSAIVVVAGAKACAMNREEKEGKTEK